MLHKINFSVITLVATTLSITGVATFVKIKFQKEKAEQTQLFSFIKILKLVFCKHFRKFYIFII